MHFINTIFAFLGGAFIASVLAVTTSPVPAPIPTWAPIPPQAIGPPLNTDGYRVERLGKGAYMVSDNRYQAMFLVSSTGVVVVDAPPTIGRGLLWAVKNTTDMPITHLVYSHSHADHIGAAYLIAPKGSKVQIVAHQLTFNILKMDAEPTRPLPHVTFDKEYTLRLSNQVLQLSYKGLNHHPGNIFCWAPFSNLGQTKFVPGYIKAFDQALEYDFDRFVAGHVTRWGTRKDVEDGKRYVLELKENCARAIELSALPANATNPLNANAIIGPVQQANPDNLWAAFKVYVDTLAEYCAEKTNEKWIGVLAAVDTFGFENAYTMVESLRIDYGVLGPFGVLN